MKSNSKKHNQKKKKKTFQAKNETNKITLQPGGSDLLGVYMYVQKVQVQTNLNLYVYILL